MALAWDICTQPLSTLPTTHANSHAYYVTIVCPTRSYIAAKTSLKAVDMPLVCVCPNPVCVNWVEGWVGQAADGGVIGQSCVSCGAKCWPLEFHWLSLLRGDVGGLLGLWTPGSALVCPLFPGCTIILVNLQIPDIIQYKDSLDCI